MANTARTPPVQALRAGGSPDQLRGALSDLERRVLVALPMDSGPRRWLTALDVVRRVGIETTVVRSALDRLRARSLVEDDGASPQAFARAVRGDVALEHTALLSGPGRRRRRRTK
jgi:hypothetical protein